jgi:hypothetical protein
MEVTRGVESTNQIVDNPTLLVATGTTSGGTRQRDVENARRAPFYW